MKIMILASAILLTGNVWANVIICKVNDTIFESNTESLIISKDLEIKSEINFCYGCSIYTLKAIDSKGELLSSASALVGDDVGHRQNNDPASLNIKLKLKNDVISCSAGIGSYRPVLF